MYRFTTTQRIKKKIQSGRIAVTVFSRLTNANYGRNRPTERTTNEFEATGSVYATIVG